MREQISGFMRKCKRVDHGLGKQSSRLLTLGEIEQRNISGNAKPTF